jgi:3-dehydroquinate synthase
MKIVTVELGGQRNYPIYIGATLLGDRQWLQPHIDGRQVCIVTNETVAPLYLEALVEALRGYQVNTVVLPDGENYKNLETMKSIYDCLLQHKHNRTTTLIALGGGVIGDMAGYAAATYQRGVKFIQIPTTLLSQVDSSVGGKTGVNHPLGKNMIGAFHQPQCVIIDTQVLKTLPSRELSAGLAEVIKYGLISDRDFFQWLEQYHHQLLLGEPKVIAEVIERSCQNKASVVAKDEKETGIRAILNLGHTFGHAIETIKGYGEWLHGEAVAAGMVIASELSHQLGWLSHNDVDRVKRLLQYVNLPISLPNDISPEQLLETMQLDKKVVNGNLRLILLRAIGHAIIAEKVSYNQIRQAIAAATI